MACSSASQLQLSDSRPPARPLGPDPVPCPAEYALPWYSPSLHWPVAHFMAPAAEEYRWAERPRIWPCPSSVDGMFVRRLLQDAPVHDRRMPCWQAFRIIDERGFSYL